MDFLAVGLTSLLVSALTLFSGFGLGTLLLPVFALFFPVDVAVAATAVVHFANNAFKVGAVGKHASSRLVLGFGLPAILAAFAGAAALGLVSHVQPLATYSIGSIRAEVTPVKLAVAALVLGFALLELSPRLQRLRFNGKKLVLGGLASGFFGGFSGHQGALRSAFLAQAGVSTEAFVGTNAVIGFLVDVARLATYTATFLLAGAGSPLGPKQWPLVGAAVAAAFAGVMLGKRYLHAVPMRTVQAVMGALLLCIAAALAAGII
ncbi:TSUP family transporter [Desulfohalovibrio reitneri]|uniref:TSUP family transporter n=1 Tax=Desulfohalovibrio reitneri TaxID=1307759 RepID=UPI0004A753A7|nr:TSUP family transporter [Desulfohalovibrio reitneri]